MTLLHEKGTVVHTGRIYKEKTHTNTTPTEAEDESNTGDYQVYDHKYSELNQSQYDPNASSIDELEEEEYL